MFGTINTGLSGLLGFSKGLDILSNNVANLNSPGFKASEIAFRDLFYRFSTAAGNGGGSSVQLGQGVNTGPTTMRFHQGELRETGNALDVAINGNGFFILRQNGEVFYTRSGQFDFDDQGFLIDKATEARVAGLGGAGDLRDINIQALRTNPPRATTEVNFIGNLSRGGTTHEINNLTVFDAVGGSHVLKLVFTNNNATTSGSWLIAVRDSADAVVANGEIRFQGNGSPTTGFNTMTFTFSPTGVPATTITLNFGEPGSFTGATNFSGGTTSDARVDRQNGFAAGALVEASFDDKGALTTKYSNAQNGTHDGLALAWFQSLQSLNLVGGNLFISNGKEVPRIERAQEGVMGRIEPKHVELSNVELTEQFTDMVVIQRGFQASSQVVSVTNEMIQQLFDLRSRR